MDSLDNLDADAHDTTHETYDHEGDEEAGGDGDWASSSEEGDGSGSGDEDGGGDDNTGGSGTMREACEPSHASCSLELLSAPTLAKQRRQRWTSLSWGGLSFPPPYERHDTEFLYDGRVVPLSDEAEESAAMLMPFLATRSNDPIFLQNFIAGFNKLVALPSVEMEFEKCNFQKFHEWWLLNKSKQVRRNCITHAFRMSYFLQLHNIYSVDSSILVFCLTNIIIIFLFTNRLTANPIARVHG